MRCQFHNQQARKGGDPDDAGPPPSKGQCIEDQLVGAKLLVKRFWDRLSPPLLRRDYAKLLQHAHRVLVAPVLSNLTLTNAGGIHDREGNRFARSWHAWEVPV
jgi:hypothetical protein